MRALCVTGCLAQFPDIPTEGLALLNLGICLFPGEMGKLRIAACRRPAKPHGEPVMLSSFMSVCVSGLSGYDHPQRLFFQSLSPVRWMELSALSLALCLCFPLSPCCVCHDLPYRVLSPPLCGARMHAVPGGQSLSLCL